MTNDIPMVYKIDEDPNQDAQTPPEIHGVTLGNRVAKNSYQGQLSTDKGAWSSKTAKELGKIHTHCCKHKSNGVASSMGGLEELGSKYRVDMNQLIYHVMESVDELESINICRY